jgi:hypothetical protein
VEGHRNDRCELIARGAGSRLSEQERCGRRFANRNLCCAAAGSERALARSSVLHPGGKPKPIAFKEMCGVRQTCAAPKRLNRIISACESVRMWQSPPREGGAVLSTEMMATRGPEADEIYAYQRILGAAVTGDGTLFARGGSQPGETIASPQPPRGRGSGVDLARVRLRFENGPRWHLAGNRGEHQQPRQTRADMSAKSSRPCSGNPRCGMGLRLRPVEHASK